MPNTVLTSTLLILFLAFISFSYGSSSDERTLRRQLPSNATGFQSITSPEGVKIRYTEPGKKGICETTAGVNSYAGYIDLNNRSHTFFWFFEARRNPHTAPFTLWLNGGPGSDSLTGLFTENGPCNISEDLTSELNPYSWSEVSNMLYISQPLGVGFSYHEERPGHIDVNGLFQNGSSGSNYGRYPQIDPKVDTTELAAISAWQILQGFLGALPQLDARLNMPKSFNLWTESYGGHYGPAFLKHFKQQNKMIANRTAKGVPLVFDTLGVGNGLIDAKIQTPFYPEFAVNNTYGIKTVNKSVVQEMINNIHKPGGCIDSMDTCASANRSTSTGKKSLCASAQIACATNVESLWETNSPRGVYDIRVSKSNSSPSTRFMDYLNAPAIQNALGVNLNYSQFANYDVFDAFANSGDYAYPYFKSDFEWLLENNVRVTLYHGDADFIANWFGGEAISLAMNFPHATSFRKAGYAPFIVNGTKYGEVREYGNFSFLRIYEAGHAIASYQPKAALEMFRRMLGSKDLATGKVDMYDAYGTTGGAHATHKEPFVALPNATAVGG